MYILIADSLLRVKYFLEIIIHLRVFEYLPCEFMNIRL